MSVYIKGMEMPGSCDKCRFFVDAWCYAFEADDWRNAYYKPPEGERRNNCPLVPVPDHGRLGDLDELKKRLKKPVTMDANRAERLWEGWHECTIGVEQTIDALPTIIPADKEEEG